MSKKLWGGRFSKPTDKCVEAFTESISFDRRLLKHDITGSIAHANMLGKCGIISAEDTHKIVSGLKRILEDFKSGKTEFDPAAEDVHMNVESALKELIGEPAGRLHTARSRNDQIATDIRLFLKTETPAVIGSIYLLQSVLVEQAEKHVQTIMPGYTHLQHAQPVSLGHHLMAWFWMLERDKKRLEDALVRIDVLPLGSGALAGTTFPVDREMLMEELGFAEISANSMDAVADRDFAAEFIWCMAMLMVHLSRFSEEIVLWNSTEFGFIRLDDSVTTGSSIMPQKKNPDVAELVRGKSARVIGDLMTILTLQKGLPLAYNRDLQEDKEPIFDAVDTVQGSLEVFAIMMNTAEFHRTRMEASAAEGYSTATDLADHLVRQGVAFRDAHEQVGALVAYCSRNDKELYDLTLEEIREFAPKAAENVMEILTVQASVEARNSAGGTSFANVKQQIKRAKQIFEKTKNDKI